MVGVGLDHIEIIGEEQVLLGGTADQRLRLGQHSPDAIGCPGRSSAVHTLPLVQILISGIVVLGIELAGKTGWQVIETVQVFRCVLRTARPGSVEDVYGDRRLRNVLHSSNVQARIDRVSVRKGGKIIAEDPLDLSYAGRAVRCTVDELDVRVDTGVVREDHPVFNERVGIA